MKFLRHGLAYQEKPGVLDALDRVRDRSDVLLASLARLTTLDIHSLPLVPG